MAAKRQQTPKPPTKRGARGRIGPTGPAGPPGPAGHNHTSEIAVLKAQVEQLVKELQIQLTRIGQIQAQLDRFTGGESTPEPRNRRTSDRSDRVDH